jgi:hypothetical protein
LSTEGSATAVYCILSYQGRIFTDEVPRSTFHNVAALSPVLHFDIIVLIIDNVGENRDTNLLKELALISHSFLQLCSKHLFATFELHDADPEDYVASSKTGFV